MHTAEFDALPAGRDRRARRAASTSGTHVLDAGLGRPTAGTDVVLTLPDGSTTSGRTDADGRVRMDADLPAGVHTVRCETGPWSAAQQRETSHPAVTVGSTMVEGEHHHVALLGPFGYTTCRGSR